MSISFSGTVTLGVGLCPSTKLNSKSGARLSGSRKNSRKSLSLAIQAAIARSVVALPTSDSVTVVAPLTALYLPACPQSRLCRGEGVSIHAVRSSSLYALEILDRDENRANCPGVKGVKSNYFFIGSKLLNVPLK